MTVLAAEPARAISGNVRGGAISVTHHHQQIIGIREIHSLDVFSLIQQSAKMEFIRIYIKDFPIMINREPQASCTP